MAISTERSESNERCGRTFSGSFSIFVYLLCPLALLLPSRIRRLLLHQNMDCKLRGDTEMWQMKMLSSSLEIFFLDRLTKHSAKSAPMLLRLLLEHLASDKRPSYRFFVACKTLKLILLSVGKGADRFEPDSGKSISVLTAQCHCGVHCYNFISFIARMLIVRSALNLFAIRLNNEHRANTQTHDNCRLFVSFVSCAPGTAAIDFSLRCIRAA